MRLLLALAFPRQAKTDLQVMLVKGSGHLLDESSNFCVSQTQDQIGKGVWRFGGYFAKVLQCLLFVCVRTLVGDERIVVGAPTAGSVAWTYSSSTVMCEVFVAVCQDRARLLPSQITSVHTIRKQKGVRPGDTTSWACRVHVSCKWG